MRWILVMTAVALGTVSTPARGVDTAPPSKRALYAQRPARAKIASALLHASDLLARQISREEVAAAAPTVRFRGDAVELDVRLWTLTPDLIARIQALGFEVRHAHYGAAQLALSGPPDALERLAALPEVSTIHPRYAPRFRTGAVDDQADVTTGARAARAAFGVDGGGVSVGILSDSFNDRIGGTITGSDCTRTLTGSAPQLSGDLPSTVTVIDSGPGGGTDEGAAMAELVHDLAPGSEILFRAAVIDEADFADGIDALRTCGAGIIVDDTIFLSEPMFQDGFVAQAATRALAAGVPVFSAAGNEATFGVEQTFVDPDPASEEADYPTGIDFNDFGGGHKFAGITIPAGCGIEVVLQWNEPFSGTLGPGASTDLDLYLYAAASASSTILADSVDSQGCSTANRTPGGDPLEILQYTNTAAQARTVYVAVDNFCPGGSPLFRLATFGVKCGFPGGYVFDPSIFNGPELYGHAAADGVVAVAAVDYRELDSGGTLEGSPGQIDVEPYSSLGGDLPFFFDASGTPLLDAPEFRFKPDLAAPDGTNTTFFGTDITGDADSYPNFFGTSAAAPHAAAVAALVRQVKPSFTPADVRRILTTSALDIGAKGLDPLAGAGEVEANAALGTAVVATPSTPTATQTPTATSTTPETPGIVPGDCDGDGRVTVSDLIRGVRIALGEAAITDCPSFDRNGDGRVSISELIQAVDTALSFA